jgi:hypothetical protein
MFKPLNYSTLLLSFLACVQLLTFMLGYVLLHDRPMTGFGFRVICWTADVYIVFKQLLIAMGTR